MDCEGCRTFEFMCNDASRCIDREKLCDHIDDCGDGSDELNCPGIVLYAIHFHSIDTVILSTRKTTVLIIHPINDRFITMY